MILLLTLLVTEGWEEVDGEGGEDNVVSMLTGRPNMRGFIPVPASLPVLEMRLEVGMK